MLDQPLISVIIPVYNGERYLAEAIDSVLSQNYSPLEIIVADDGSTDNSADIARSYAAVQYCYQANTGCAGARNYGLQLARGQWLAFLDADDVWTPGKLALQSAALRADAELEAVLGHTQQFFCADLSADVRARTHCPPHPQAGWHHSSMLIRREAFLRVGTFDASLPIGDIIEWFTRATAVGLRTRMLPEVVFRRRIHASNLGRTNHHQRHIYAHIAKAALDRRKRDVNTVGGSVS